MSSDWVPTPETTPRRPWSHDLNSLQRLDEKGQPNGYAGLDEAGHVPESQLAAVGSGGARALEAVLPTNALVQEMASKPVSSSPPTLGSRVTGLTTSTEAANTTIPNSSRIAPNYAAPRTDPTYRISGPFGYFGGNTAQDVGAFQATTPAGTVGPTSMAGSVSFEFVGRKFELWMRDTTGTQYLTIWVSKNGGPFKAHTNPDVGTALASPGGGLYYLLPVDMGSRETWRIKIEYEAGTFGGVRLFQGRADAAASAISGATTITDAAVIADDTARAVTGTNIPSGAYVGAVTAGVSFALVDSSGNALATTGAVSGVTIGADIVRYPSWSTQRVLCLTDSYGVLGGSIDSIRTLACWPLKLARFLGMDLHLSGRGGTGISATSGGTALKYIDRLATEITPYFSQQEQPAVVVVQGSINDGLYGFAGSSQFNSDTDKLIGTLQALYPDALLLVTHPMHPYRGDAAANANDATIAGQIDAILTARALPAAYDGVSDIPLTGSGTTATPTGVGNSDIYSASDHQHPTSAGADAIVAGTDGTATSHGLVHYIVQTAQQTTRTFTGTRNLPSAMVVASALAQAKAAAAALAPILNTYKRIEEFKCTIPAGTPAGTYVLTPTGIAAVGAAGSALGLLPIYLTENAISGYTINIRGSFTCNVSANAGGAMGTIAITGNLALAGSMSAAAAGAVAAGANQGNTVTFTNPAVGSKSGRSSTGDVAFSSDTYYLLTVTLSAPIPANCSVDLTGEVSWHQK